jgi:hypothetical protein
MAPLESLSRSLKYFLNFLSICESNIIDSYLPCFINHLRYSWPILYKMLVFFFKGTEKLIREVFVFLLFDEGKYVEILFKVGFLFFVIEAFILFLIWLALFDEIRALSL